MSAPEEESGRFTLSRYQGWILFAAFAVSGVAALIYQVAWARAFTPIFGGTTRAAAAVVSAFFLGMAAGNWLGGRRATSRADSLRLYASAECLIALGSLWVLGWLVLYRAGYPTFYGWGEDRPGVVLLAQVLLALIALGPPSLAMGATLPLMARVVTDRIGQIGFRVGGAYALNTLGATVGAGLAGFLLLELLGTRGSLLFAATLNLFVAVIAWGVFRGGPVRAKGSRGGGPEPSARERKPAPVDDLSRVRMAVAALSGCSTLALQVFFVRLLVNQTDGSSYSFALILCVFLVSLALGAGLCAWRVDELSNPWRIVAWSGSLAALGTFLVPLGFGLGRGILAELALALGYWTAIVIFSAALMGPTVVVAGMALPALWKMASRIPEQVGEQVGRLTAVNTLAGVVGSLAAGFVLLPALGIVRGFSLVALSFCLLAGVGWFCSTGGVRRGLALGLMSILAVGLFLAEGWQVNPLTLRPGETVIHYAEGEAGSVAVTRLPAGSLRLRVNDRYTLTSDVPSALRAQRSQTRLALGLTDQPESVAFIGVGGAISMGALTEFSTVQRVLAMELVPGVLRATSYFEAANRNILADPRVEAVAADGRNHLYGRTERFDAIVGDVFSPWHAGTGYLYTAEHFEAVARSLSDEGVFVQWLQVDQLSVEELRIVVATFLDVFPRAEIWTTQRSGPVALLGLVGRAPGGKAGPLNLAPAQRRFLAQICQEDRLRSWTAEEERNTDDRPIVEYRAGWAHRFDARPTRSRVMPALSEICGFDLMNTGRPGRRDEPRGQRKKRSREQ